MKKLKEKLKKLEKDMLVYQKSYYAALKIIEQYEKMIAQLKVEIASVK